MVKKIALCGSMMFAKEMLEIKKQLEEYELKIHIQEDAKEFADGERRNEDKWQKLKIDPFKEYFKVIQDSDAILVVNIDKKGVTGYVGGNTLIEMAFAHVLNKRIYLLNDIPRLSYTDEIESMNPIVINGQLDRLLENK